MPAVTVTGASGLIGRRLVGELQRAGWEVTILSREPLRAQNALGEVETYRWDPVEEPAPAAGAGRPRRGRAPRRRAGLPALDARCQAGDP